MARLTAAERNNLRTDQFADRKNREYPIENASHARDALRMVAAHGSEHQKALVRSAVKSHYPSIKIGKQG